MNFNYNSPFQANESTIGGRANTRGFGQQPPTAFTPLFPAKDAGHTAEASMRGGQGNPGSPLKQQPMNIRILCPKHNRFIVQVCLHTNCKERLLCQRCVNEHISSHVACFESPEELFSTVKVDELRQFIGSSDSKRINAETNSCRVSRRDR